MSLLIAGAFALAGVIIGGAVTYGVIMENKSRQQKQEIIEAHARIEEQNAQILKQQEDLQNAINRLIELTEQVDKAQAEALKAKKEALAAKKQALESQQATEETLQQLDELTKEFQELQEQALEAIHGRANKLSIVCNGETIATASYYEDGYTKIK